MKPIIAFDYDGVLVDSIDLNVSIAQELCREIGIECLPTAEDIAALEEMSFAMLGRNVGMTPDQVEYFLDGLMPQLVDKGHTAQLFPGIADVLSQLSQVATLMVMTANLEGVVNTVLERDGVLSCFERVIGHDTPGSKADKLTRIREESGLPADRLAMVGDAASDLVSGHQAGILSVGVTWGYQPIERLQAENPYLICRRPEDLLELRALAAE